MKHCSIPRDELEALRAIATTVRDELVPIVEMSDEANDPGQDLYVVMHNVKELLRSLQTGSVDR